MQSKTPGQWAMGIYLSPKWVSLKKSS